MEHLHALDYHEKNYKEQTLQLILSTASNRKTKKKFYKIGTRFFRCSVGTATTLGVCVGVDIDVDIGGRLRLIGR